MNKKLVYGLIGLALVVVAVLLVVRLRGSTVDIPPISVPSPSAEGGSSGNQGANFLNVDTDTVQELVKSLSRADSYNLGYEQISYYTGGESSAAINIFKSGDKLLINRTQKNINKNILIADGEISIWYGESKPVFSALLDDYNYSAADGYASLITYEELLKADPRDILDAGYEVVQDMGCIYVEYRSSGEYSDRSYTNRLYISVDTGLLTAAEVLEDNVKVYSLQLHISNMTTPSEAVFELPS